MPVCLYAGTWAPSFQAKFDPTRVFDDLKADVVAFAEDFLQVRSDISGDLYLDHTLVCGVFLYLDDV